MLVSPRIALSQPTINVPSDPAPNQIGDTTILNVNDGGILPQGFTAGGDSTVNVYEGGYLRGRNDVRTNAELNMLGGTVSGDITTLESAKLNLNSGSLNGDVFISEGQMEMTGGEVRAKLYVSSNFNMTGGDAGPQFNVFADANASIHGGTVGGFRPRANSNTSLFGSEFLVDGAPIAGFDGVGDSVPFNLPEGSLFSGVLSDGTPFVFSNDDFDQIEDNALTLVRTVEAPAGPEYIDVPTDFGGWGIRAGQTVTVCDGGMLSNNFNAGPESTVVVDGGNVGQNLEALGSEITLLDGGIGRFLTAFPGTNVRIENGTVGEGFQVWSGSTVEVNGGRIAEGVVVQGGAEFTINGGRFGYASGGPSDLTSLPGSIVNINGGELGDTIIGGLGYVQGGDIGGLSVREMAKLEISAGNIGRFSADSGELVMTGGSLGDQSSARYDSVLNIYDGTVGNLFTLVLGAELNLHGGSIGYQFQAIEEGAVANVSGGTIGDDGSAKAGAIINLTAGSIGKRFLATDGATVNISDGHMGKEFLAEDEATVNIEGGFIDISLKATTNATINIEGGDIAAFMVAESGATVNISGGTTGPLFTVRDASVEMTGGHIGPLLTLEENALFNRSGGMVDEGLMAQAGSTLNLFGQAFAIDGVPIEELQTWNDSFIITQREGALLEGLLLDGTPFQLTLNGSAQAFNDFVDPQATLRVTLVPEPSANGLLLLGATLMFAWRRLRDQIGTAGVPSQN